MGSLFVSLHRTVIWAILTIRSSRLPFHQMVKWISPNRDNHFTRRGNVIRKQLLTSYIIPPYPPKGERRPLKEDKQTVQAMLHAYTGEDQELAQALDDLMEVRSAKKAVDSPRAISTLLNKLDKLADGSRELKLQIVRESVTNSWKGVFPLRGGQAPAARREVERHVE